MPESNPNIRRVLVVEDSPDLVRLYTKYLRQRGFHVDGTGSIAEAKDYLASNKPPNVVILDLDLGDGSGREVVEVLCDPPFEDVKIVIVSGNTYNPGNDLEMARIDYALLKPVSPRGLTTLVQALVI